MPEINWRARLTEPETEQLVALLAAAQRADGRPNFDPADGLPGDFLFDGQSSTGEYGLATEGAELVGVVTRNTGGDSFGRQVAELVVHPERRRRGIGSALLQALLDRVGPAAPDGAETLRVWSHGDHPAAAALAARFGLRRVRELRRMLLTIADLPDGLPQPRALPDDLRLRTFRIGKDEHALVEVNHRAFAWHPEQGALSVADVEADEAQSWFDPEGLFLAVRADDTLVGFHWTKIHQELDGAGAPMGEVYVVGVDPSASGHGLGTTLTLTGLRYLANRGCRQIMLYVESDNAAAIAVYSRLGFSDWDADVQYAY